MIGFSTEALTYLSLLGIFLGMSLLMWFCWLMTTQRSKRALCPYTKHPLRPFTDLRYTSVSIVQAYMEKTTGYENQMFSIFRAAYCRETGRIFPTVIGWFGHMNLGWDFLTKHCRGNYVSWGSLAEDQQREIQEVHDSLDGFQTEMSCSHPNPKDILPEYIYLKPGPLYVDIETHILVGWKCLPDSDLEVLIVQKPKIKGQS